MKPLEPMPTHFCHLLACWTIVHNFMGIFIIFSLFNQNVSSNLNFVNSCIVVAGLVNKLKTTRPNHAKYALRTILPADTAAFCGSKKNPKSSIVDRVPAGKFNDKTPW